MKIEESHIGSLIYALKELQTEVKAYYEHDQLLLDETETFVRVCRKVVGTLCNYSAYFKENNDLIVKYFTLTKKQVYADLFKKSIEPIINIIKILRKQENNSYADALSQLLIEKQISPNNTYILTKKNSPNEYIEINHTNYKVMRDKEFVSLGIFADVVIFLGTPSYFSKNSLQYFMEIKLYL